MKYDFHTLPDRSCVGSAKWTDMQHRKPNVGKETVPLSVADMEFVNPPEIIEGLKRFLDHSVLGYTLATDACYDAVISWMKRRKNWDVKRESIVCSAGVVPALYVGVRAYTDPGDGVLLMTPAYPPFYGAVTENGRRVIASPLLYRESRYEIDFDDIDRKTQAGDVKLLILCNPHNPTGRSWRREELERLGDICLKNHLIVIADEIHSDLMMPGIRHTVFSTVRPEFAGISAICTAPSKTFNLAGMQTSHIMIENPELRKKFEMAQQISGSGSMLNILGYEACRLAYNECEEWLEELISVIWENHQRVKSFCTEYLPKVVAAPLEGTYLQWLDFSAYGLEKEEQERINEAADLFLDEGYIFGPEGEGFERVNLACPTWVLERALERLGEVYGRIG